LQTLKAFRRHPHFVGAAIEPLAPKPSDFVSETVQRLGVADNPVVIVAFQARRGGEIDEIWLAAADWSSPKRTVALGGNAVPS
jgi:hypothetical protein